MIKPQRPTFTANETKTFTFTEDNKTVKVASWLVKNFTTGDVTVSVGTTLDGTDNCKIPKNGYQEIRAGQLLPEGYTAWEEAITIKSAAGGEVEVEPLVWG